jgi:hypothetical protein
MGDIVAILGVLVRTSVSTFAGGSFYLNEFKNIIVIIFKNGI